MKRIGIFEAKTKLSEICDEVARTNIPVEITRRGRVLVRIEPASSEPMTIRERRAVYHAKYGAQEMDDVQDFEPAPRSKDQSKFEIEG